MARHKDAQWNLPDKVDDWQQCILSVLMDIRDNQCELIGLARCYRIPRALDAMYELGVEARRRKRLAAAKRKKAKAAGRG